MSEHGASELAGSSLVTKNKNPEGELTGENFNELKTGLHEILREIQEFNIDYSIDEVEFLQKCTGWLTSLNQFIAEISQHFPLEEAEQSNIQSCATTLNDISSLLQQKFLRFERTQPSLFKPNPANLATANRLDPDGRYIDLRAVAELHLPNFWLDIKSQIEKIAKQLIKIIEEKSNTSPEQSQVESGPSDEKLQEELEKFNQELRKINEAADREILKGIVDYLFRNTIEYTVYYGVGGKETKRLTIMELVSILLKKIQESKEAENKEDDKISKILEKEGAQKLYLILREFINSIPISVSISSENMQKYVELFNRLCNNNNNKLTGKKVEIVLRDTSKLFYLKALLKKINEQEQEILDILNRSFKKLRQELNIIDVFTNALRFLIEIIETNETRIKNSAAVKTGVVSFEIRKMKRGIGSDGLDITSTMVLREMQDFSNKKPKVYKFISYPQYMRSLFNIDEISLVGK